MQVGVSHVDFLMAIFPEMDSEADMLALGVDWQDAEGGVQKEQYPRLPMSARRPHSSGHGIFPASHEMQKGPRPTAGRSGHKGAAQRLFLEGSYKHPL